jgi:hypothetical protein
MVSLGLWLLEVERKSEREADQLTLALTSERATQTSPLS